MPLETATYISDLVNANPAHTDSLSQADSHMRLLKSTLKTTFPNVTGAVTTTHTALNSAGTAATSGASLLAKPSAITVDASGLFFPNTTQTQVTAGGQTVATFDVGHSMAVVGAVTAAAVGSTGAYSGGTGQLVPIGATLLWWDDVLPTEGGYAWANGQIIASANTVCPVLLARWGTKFGGNGVTTMGVPDLRDTTPVGKDTMGAVSSRGLIFQYANAVLGTLFGEANHTLATSEIPSHTHANTLNDPTHAHTYNAPLTFGASGSGSGINGSTQTSVTTFNSTGITISNAAQGGGGSHNNVQPSTTCNYILRLA